MSIKVGLIDVPVFPFGESKRDIPSLTLGYLGAALLGAGYNVFIIDAARWKKSFRLSYQRLIDERPNVIGFTCTTMTRFATIELIRKIKNVYSPLIIVGGCHFTFTAIDALQRIKEIDIVVRGEGEDTIVEIANAYKNNKDYQNVKGITYRSISDEIVENPDRPFASFDRILPPAWDLFDLGLYNDTLESTNLKVIGLMSSRGCPQRCTFCANSAMGKTALRLRNPLLVVDEMESLHTKFGYSAFKFSDDTLTINKAHVAGICSEILKRNLKVAWSARARVNTVDKELLELMKKSGCVSLHYGVESGSQKILHMMQKGIKLQEVKNAIMVSSSVGFNHIAATFIVNYPKETLEDIDSSFMLMQELRKCCPDLKIAYGFALIYPGTEIERIAHKEGIFPKGFSWNAYYRAPKYFIAKCAETDIYYEGKEHTLERIRAYISSKYAPKGNTFEKIWRICADIHSLQDLVVVLQFAKSMAFAFCKRISLRRDRPFGVFPA